MRPEDIQRRDHLADAVHLLDIAARHLRAVPDAEHIRQDIEVALGDIRELQDIRRDGRTVEP